MDSDILFVLQVASLGNGNDHVMDYISQCEQIYREQEECEGEVPWKLYYRKEMFSPWESATSDPVATNLIYAQTVRGVVLEEYECDDVSVFNRETIQFIDIPISF